MQRCIACITMSQNEKTMPETQNDVNLVASLPGSARTIVLVGLMGSGKSTIGRRLAAALNLPFIDADAEIEIAAGMSITEIFDKFGEAHFRSGERRVIARLMDGPRCVLATGGGAFINPETRALILEKALCIWLDTDVHTLAERVARRDTRPLLRGKDPVAVLTELAAIRNPIYAQAHLRVSSTRSPHEHTVDRILKELAAWPA